MQPALLPEEIEQIRAIHRAMQQRRPTGDKTQLRYVYAVEDLLLGLTSVGGGETLRANSVIEPAKVIRAIGLRS